jgi:putative transposase
LKENLLWVQTFDTIEELRQALLAFRETYNAIWLIERHGFISPAAFRQTRLQPAALAA